jgi:hypothetical protein
VMSPSLPLPFDDNRTPYEVKRIRKPLVYKGVRPTGRRAGKPLEWAG